jgi:1,4-dihydroxy-6-naphthoate synthase
MTNTAAAEIVCAHSPDSDDAYMFYALATRKIRSSLVQFRHVLDDIQTLNQKARAGEYELTAVSYHMALEDLKGKRIAIPGKLTTAYLTLRLMQPDFHAVEVPFDKILDAVTEGRADAGLVIHEAQLTFSKSGFHNIIDLGRWWKNKYNLPLPLGANVLRRDLAPEIGTECCRLMRESLQYALDHRVEALNYAMQFARDMEPALADKFVGMYVNHYTVDCGEQVPVAAQKLLDMGFDAGIIPHRVTVEFVR